MRRHTASKPDAGVCSIRFARHQNGTGTFDHGNDGSGGRDTRPESNDLLSALRSVRISQSAKFLDAIFDLLKSLLRSVSLPCPMPISLRSLDLPWSDPMTPAEIHLQAIRLRFTKTCRLRIRLKLVKRPLVRQGVV